MRGHNNDDDLNTNPDATLRFEEDIVDSHSEIEGDYDRAADKEYFPLDDLRNFNVLKRKLDDIRAQFKKTGNKFPTPQVLADEIMTKIGNQPSSRKKELFSVVYNHHLFKAPFRFGKSVPLFKLALIELDFSNFKLGKINLKNINMEGLIFFPEPLTESELFTTLNKYHEKYVATGISRNLKALRKILREELIFRIQALGPGIEADKLFEAAVKHPFFSTPRNRSILKKSTFSQNILAQARVMMRLELRKKAESVVPADDAAYANWALLTDNITKLNFARLKSVAAYVNDDRNNFPMGMRRAYQAIYYLAANKDKMLNEVLKANNAEPNFPLHLKHAHLDYRDLRGADLRYANLALASLKGANLTGADLSYANISKVEFKFAQFFPRIEILDEWNFSDKENEPFTKETLKKYLDLYQAMYIKNGVVDPNFNILKKHMLRDVLTTIKAIDFDGTKSTEANELLNMVEGHPLFNINTSAKKENKVAKARNFIFSQGDLYLKHEVKKYLQEPVMLAGLLKSQGKLGNKKSHLNLSHADLHNSDLSGLDLRYVNLFNANLIDADLTNVKMLETPATVKDVKKVLDDFSKRYAKSTNLDILKNVLLTNIVEALKDPLTEQPDKIHALASNHKLFAPQSGSSFFRQRKNAPNPSQVILNDALQAAIQNKRPII